MPKFHVTRSIEIDASPEKVFGVVSDFNTWPKWSPWLIAEPEAKVTISSESNSVGSTYAWDGDVTGAGELQWQKLDGPNYIESEIRFLRPMKSVSKVSFNIESVGSGSRIHWNMDGSLPWFLFWMVGMMNGWIGSDYDRGLKMLKEWIETGHINSRVIVHGKDIVESIRMVGVRRTCTFDKMMSVMEDAIVELHHKLETAGIRDHGLMMTVYHRFNMKKQETEFTIGYTIPDSETAPDDLDEWSTLATPAYYIEHIGSYEHLGNAWSTGQTHLRNKKLKASKTSPFEIYRNSPSETDEKDLVTDVYMPLK
ncbi:Bacterial transcription activator, effector binding domain [Polystyrenella longa]|uniref:Bacterial transcription activator, effector binding domain n=1 Tax=Polystyrenella longa TaxID=2528007 RepID=A0A518CKR9_9PLAN|nr:SRPBCC family protein [Polystyrenella longa]QDU79823.1 Bacterial transcription activator, effector binding domain [Polystyrenella longa]